MTFCKHQTYNTIDWIKEPKYSTNEILINCARIPEHVEHFLVKFTDCKSIPNWFYLSGKKIRKSPKQSNGRIQVYAVSLNHREEFTPLSPCSHDW